MHLAAVDTLRDRFAVRLKPLRRAFSYEFRDCRLILEQNGDVHHLVVPAGFQRRVVQVALGLLALGLLIILGMAANSAVLSNINNRLTRSHDDIQRALLETYGEGGAESDKSDVASGALSEDQMLVIANSIRQRNREIQRFVDSSLASISGENVELTAALRGSGLTESAIRLIQLSTPVGGYAADMSLKGHSAEVNELATAITKNHDLRDVLSALPERLPLDAAGLSSKFGLRANPFTGKPQFHTGIDLLPSGDLSVRSVLPGKVVMAAYGEERGNVVVVRHRSGVESLYGHLASISVHLGDEVTESTVLGIVGNTGTASTGRHLHFEVSIGGYPVNPLKVIRTAEDVRKIQAQR
jgi:murein DD-endopeptidase MepM/ murein hydrolase activator NlpD